MTELEMRVLSELEEAGEEEIETMMNTVTELSGAPGEVVSLQEALKSLVTSNFILMSVRISSNTWDDASKAQSISNIEDASSHLTFVEKTGFWTDDRAKGSSWGKMPIIVCTPKGKELAWKILDERGYQWWKKK